MFVCSIRVGFVLVFVFGIRVGFVLVFVLVFVLDSF